MNGARSRGSGWIGRLALVLGATLFTLIACEIALRVLGYAPIYSVYSHPEVFWQRDELLGWSHTPGSQGTYVGPRPWPIEFEAPVQINSLGLRGPELAPRPPGGIRVMLLGDSTTAAFEVPWEQTFGALLEARLTRELGLPVQIINAGVRGYGSDQSYLYYKERGSQLEPDIVVLLYGGNDLSDNVTLHRMRRIFGKGALALREGGTLEPVGFPIPEYPLCSEWLLDGQFRPRRADTRFESMACGVQTRLADRSALFTFFSMRLQQNPALLTFLYKLGSPSGSAESQPLNDGTGTESLDDGLAPRRALIEAILVALAREVRSHGAELLLPVPSPFGPDLDAAPFIAAGAQTFTIPEDLGRQEFHFLRDSHLNTRGHEIVADTLTPLVASRIRARRALPQNSAP